jgi:hypothetical protein
MTQIEDMADAGRIKIAIRTITAAATVPSAGHECRRRMRRKRRG